MNTNQKTIWLLISLTLACLTLPSVTSTQEATKVTFSGGSGVSGNSIGQTHFTVGQYLVGRTGPDANSLFIGLGFWELLREIAQTSATDENLPIVGNHLFRNYPNPFNPSTRISFNLENKTAVRLELYDLKGRKVDTLLQEIKPAGAHFFNYQPKNLASGAYLLLMRAGTYRASQRIMLVK